MKITGRDLPQVNSGLLGVQGSNWIDKLASTEVPSLTQRRARRRETSGVDQDPITWTEALGSNVVDSDGNIFVDMVGGFGVAFLGHRHPFIHNAIEKQLSRLVHGFGDYQPSDAKIALMEKLQQISPLEDCRVMLGLSGADATEAAMKTAMLARRKNKFIAFKNSYHGLSFGALQVLGYSPAFSDPFLQQPTEFLTFPTTAAQADEALSRLQQLLRSDEFCALFVEPIQGRGGMIIPPEGFLKELSLCCQKHGVIVVADEILTGLGRTGSLWRCTSESMQPDIVLSGKALGAGLPISACMVNTEIAKAWGQPDQVPIHTSTFSGLPLACAAASAGIDLLVEQQLWKQAARVGDHFRQLLQSSSLAKSKKVRGAGLLIALDFDTSAQCLRQIAALLHRGYITLPAGVQGQCLQLSPAVNIEAVQLQGFVDALDASDKALPA